MIGIGVFGVALIVAGIWIYRRSRPPLEESEEDESEDLAEEDSATDLDSPETLMDAIITLDDQFQDGQLPESAYLERRAQLKERLRAIMGDKMS